MHGLLDDVGLVLIIATVVSLLTYYFKQPVILGYFITGVILSPEIGFKLIHDVSHLEVISEFGLILLLFIIGLELELPKILQAGKQLILTGILQFVICVAVGLFLFGVCLGSYYDQLSVLYLALLCALSSTAIVVKALYDKQEMDTLPGRITLGVLVIQDLWAILILAFQPNFQAIQGTVIVIALIKCMILVLSGYVLGRYVLKYVFGLIAKSPEVIVATSLGWCAIVVAIASWLGLSKEMGALIAGAVISSFPYSVFVSGKILPLRDFFLILFFVFLGMKMPFPSIPILAQALMLTVFIGLSRFLSVYPVLRWSGGGYRTAFIASLNLSQISEFSLVIAGMGVTLGHISESLMGVFLYAMAISALIATYLIKYNHVLYSAWFSWTSGQKTSDDLSDKEISTSSQGVHPDILLLGYHRIARELVVSLLERTPELLSQIRVIDFNLEVLKELQSLGVHAMYGDIANHEVLEHVRVEKARLIISSVPDSLLKGTSNAEIVRTIRIKNSVCDIIAISENEKQTENLKKLGASQIIEPHILAGDRIALNIMSNVNI